MAKKTVSAKIGQIVYEQAKEEAKRRGKTFIYDKYNILYCNLQKTLK